MSAVAATRPAVKERGILFSAPMVRALLAGTKTQTRRIVKLPPDSGAVHVDPGGTIFGPGPYLKVENPSGDPAPMHPRLRCPYGYPGDRLWVRETWSHDAPDAETCRAAHEDVSVGIGYGPYYRATETAPDTLRWIPAIHMPRWASRIALEITDVRAERLHDITGRDVLAEGIDNGKSNPAQGERWENMQRLTFETLWSEINGADSWAANPWVWAITFKRIEAPRG